MTDRPISFCIILLTLFMVACSGSDDQSETRSETKRGRSLDYTHEVSFLSSAEDTLVTIEVAIADDEEERNQGLMDVRDLPRNKGMLFVFEDNEPRSFWMANTPLSLDLFFVNEDQEIVRIHRNAKPYSDKNLTSEDPAMYVIETNSGFSVSHDIQEGMRVSFEI